MPPPDADNPLKDLFAPEPSTASTPIGIGAPSGDATQVFACGTSNLAKVGDKATIPSTAETATLPYGNPAVLVGGLPAVGQNYPVQGDKGTPGVLGTPTTSPTIWIPSLEQVDKAKTALEGAAEPIKKNADRVVDKARQNVESIRKSVRAGGPASGQVKKVLDLRRAGNDLGAAQKWASGGASILKRGAGAISGVVDGAKLIKAGIDDGVPGVANEAAKQGAEKGLGAVCVAGAGLLGAPTGGTGAVAVGVLCAVGASAAADAADAKAKELYELQKKVWAAQKSAEARGAAALGQYLNSGGTYIGPPM